MYSPFQCFTILCGNFHCLKLQNSGARRPYATESRRVALRISGYRSVTRRTGDAAAESHSKLRAPRLPGQQPIKSELERATRRAVRPSRRSEQGVAPYPNFRTDFGVRSAPSALHEKWAFRKGKAEVRNATLRTTPKTHILHSCCRRDAIVARVPGQACGFDSRHNSRVLPHSAPFSARIFADPCGTSAEHLEKRRKTQEILE